MRSNKSSTYFWHKGDVQTIKLRVTKFACISLGKYHESAHARKANATYYNAARLRQADKSPLSSERFLLEARSKRAAGILLPSSRRSALHNLRAISLSASEYRKIRGTIRGPALGAGRVVNGLCVLADAAAMA